MLNYEKYNIKENSEIETNMLRYHFLKKIPLLEIPYDIPYMWNLKGNDTNELTKQKETHKLRK